MLFWKRLALLLVLLALPLAASAEVVGYADDELIIRWTAPNGQSIYFTAVDEQFTVTQEDVNGDGLNDLVVMTAQGASNARYEFFVQAENGYVPVRHDYPIMNYTVYRESGKLLSTSNNGSAGAEHTSELYRWVGNTLQLQRRSFSESYVETTWEDGGWRMIYEDGRLHIQVTDYTLSQPVVIYETLCTAEELFLNGIYSLEQNALLYGASGLQNAVVCAQSSDRVYLRSQPDRSSEAKGLYYTGTQVYCGETQGEWTAVTIGTQEGWMMSAYIVTGDAAASIPSLARTATATNADRVTIYREPATTAEVIFNIQAGTQLSVLGELSNGWCYVSTGTVIGYMPPMSLLR